MYINLLSLCLESSGPKQKENYVTLTAPENGEKIESGTESSNTSVDVRKNRSKPKMPDPPDSTEVSENSDSDYLEPGRLGAALDAYA